MKAVTLIGTFIFGAFLAGLCSERAAGQDAVGLRGELFIAGPELIDPSPGDPKNSHAYFTITGAAAVRLYRNIKAPEEDDICQGEGRKLKRAGGLSCSLAKGGRNATCDFALDLRDGSAAGGRPC